MDMALMEEDQGESSILGVSEMTRSDRSLIAKTEVRVRSSKNCIRHSSGIDTAICIVSNKIPFFIGFFTEMTLELSL